MRFAFTEEQLELRQAVHQVLHHECTPDHVRAAYQAVTEGDVAQETSHEASQGTAQSPSANDRQRWSVLADLGVPGLLAPDAVGGLGLDEVDLVAVAEEAGKVALPEPLGTVAGVLVPVLASLAKPDSAGTIDGGGIAAWLGRLVRGDAIGAVGGFEARPDAVGVTTAPAPDAGSTPPGGRTPPGTTGAPGSAPSLRSLVVGGGWADVLLLACRGDGGPELHLLPTSDTTSVPVATLDPTRRVLAVRWRRSPETLVADGPVAVHALEEMTCRSALVDAAELLGLTETMLSLAANYAQVRQQFGKPIGSFQAVKHLLANARVRLEFARPALYRAAWSLRRRPTDQVHDTSMALAMAADAADQTARAALQVHGAIGYTWECDLHMWMKRTWALTASGHVARMHGARVLHVALQRPADFDSDVVL